MKGSIHLTEQERKRLVKAYRSGEQVQVARRAHVLLLLADRDTGEQIHRLLSASNDLIAEVRRTFLADRVDVVLGRADAWESMPWWLSWIQRWVVKRTLRRRMGFAMGRCLLGDGRIGNLTYDEVAVDQMEESREKSESTDLYKQVVHSGDRCQ